MLNNLWVKNILSALVIAGIGFILLNLTFILDFGFQSLLRLLFYPRNQELMGTLRWLAPFQHFLFVILIGVISWFIFRTKWPVLIKAIYMVVPTAVTLVTVGILTYRWPAATYAIGAVLTLGIIYVFYRAKQPWQYWFSVILVASVLFIGGLLGMEI